MGRDAWVDASAGVAGDMLLGALVDAGADLDVVRRAVAAVLPDEVQISTERVTRAGLAAVHAVVRHAAPSPVRAWADLRGLLTGAELDERVRTGALRTFGRLAEAESRAHGIPVDEVHFHEVGAWDSVADVVGVCAALADLAVERLTCGPVGLGSGTVRTEHGTMPVPVPAVLGVLAGSSLVTTSDATLVGECATPTGVALLAALADGHETGPRGLVLAFGSGAGTRDVEGRANVTRVVLHEPLAAPHEQALVEVSATVDDLDPRVWPVAVEELLLGGALDVWTTPVLMKKGRHGTVVTALAELEDREAVVGLLLRHTTTLGVRWHEVRRTVLDRVWREVTVLGEPVRVKIGGRDGRILTVTPELEDCRELALRQGVPLRVVLRAAESAAQDSGWESGAAI
jgi:pyridinium-3,5-bisthiocarboxylic acid mononucleotide nickel chelatase